jgi:hypothetical protein
MNQNTTHETDIIVQDLANKVRYYSTEVEKLREANEKAFSLLVDQNTRWESRLNDVLESNKMIGKIVDIAQKETVSNDDFLALNSPFFKVMTMFFNITKK